MAKTSTKSGPTSKARGGGTAEVQMYQKALERLHKGQWEAAEETFTRILEGDANSTVAERSRMYREVCRSRRTATAGAPEDSYLNAVLAKNAGEFDAAMEACNRGGLKGKEERFAYLAASVEALQGRTEEAGKLLAKAIELHPANRVHAFHDPDFAILREDPGFQDLFTVS